MAANTNISTGSKYVSKKPKVRKNVHPFTSNTRTKRASKVIKFNDSDEGDHVSEQLLKERNTVSYKSLKSRANDLLKMRETLPVYQHKSEIMSYIESNPVTVLIGETGSGKSTQIPQFILEQLYDTKKHGTIAVTQPRRVAAINLATRVAQEHGCKLGDQVGYSVRFDNTTTTRTRLKYLTDGMLLRELMMNSDLREYSVIIIDEAHERTVLTDLILGFLKSLMQGPRQDLRIIVMSATLQAEKFSEFFNNAPILFVEGRKFDVKQYYLKAPTDDIVDAVIRCCIQINQGEELGDILCFLPGQEEIDKAVTCLLYTSRCV